MGFNKRYISKGTIISNLSNIERLFKADALVMDMWSSNFIEDLDPSHKKIREEILGISNRDYRNHKKFKLLNSISESIINLSNDPSWIDIEIVMDKTGFGIEESEVGNFQLLVKKALWCAIEYYDKKIY